MIRSGVAAVADAVPGDVPTAVAGVVPDEGPAPRPGRRRRTRALALAAVVVAVGTGCASLEPGSADGGSTHPDAPVTSTDEPAPTSSEPGDPSSTAPSDGDGSGDASGDGTDEGPATFPADLTIQVDATGEGAVTTTTLTCGPAGGDHPDSAAACAAVTTAWPDGFDPVPPDVMCTEIWGGPQTAHVTGTVDGTPVDATFRRSDGCHMARWDALADLLGPADLR